MRRRLGCAATALVTLTAVAGCGGSSAPRLDLSTAVTAAQSFLTTYVDSAGRVERHDQGGDTVSEGQGYALLLADVTGDRRMFDRVWSWTQAHLRRPDGLFAYHWSGGHVVDRSPAADADTQIAWALTIAAQRFHDPQYDVAARTVAAAVATDEIGYDDSGRPTLAAGPWARPTGKPVTVEPGYWTFPADGALAAVTGDQRWQHLASADAAHLRVLSNDGRSLPPDWARIGGGSNGQPTSGPNGGSTTTWSAGQDGLRALVWSACASTARPLEQRWWSLIRSTAAAAPMTRTATGAPQNRDVSPLSAVAAAAAATAAGDPAAGRQLLATAASDAQRFPTYYGVAWVALGRALLTTTSLGACAGPQPSVSG